MSDGSSVAQSGIEAAPRTETQLEGLHGHAEQAFLEAQKMLEEAKDKYHRVTGIGNEPHANEEHPVGGMIFNTENNLNGVLSALRDIHSMLMSI